MAGIQQAIPDAYANDLYSTIEEAYRWFAETAPQVPPDAIGLVFPQKGTVHLAAPRALDKFASTCPEFRAFLDQPIAPGELRVLEIALGNAQWTVISLRRPPSPTALN